MKFLRYAAAIVGIGGTIGLYLAARHMEAPGTDIGSLTAAMNFAYVRVEGTVAAQPRVSGRGTGGGYVSFRVEDRTGSVTVSAYGACARALVEEGAVPGKGDTVRVEGTVSVRAGSGSRIVVDSPECVVVTRGAAVHGPAGLGEKAP